MKNSKRPEIGDKCVVNLGVCGVIINCIVSSKTQTDQGKVYYNVKIKPFVLEKESRHIETEIKDIDSYFIEHEKDRFIGKSNMPINNVN